MNVWRHFRLSMLALAKVAGKSFNGKFIVKIDFPIWVFYVTIADADIGSLKALHTLFDKYLDYMLVKIDQIVWSELYKIFSFLTKNG